MKIETSQYLLQFIEEGAQCVSFYDKINQMEYFHDGREGWQQINPTLFPFISKLNNNKTIINNQSFEMSSHGFVRRAKFHLKEHGNNFIVFEFKSTYLTLQQFPFNFILEKRYELIDNELIITHRIKNTSDEEMPFTLGHHPAFKIAEGLESYKIYFDQREAFMDDSALKIEKATTNMPGLENAWALSLPFDTQKFPTLIAENLKSSFVTLMNDKHGVKVSSVGYKYFAFWTPKDNLLCLEPWLSCQEAPDFDGIFEHKEGIIKLASGHSFLNSYSIVVF